MSTPNPRTTSARTIVELLAALQSSDATRPRITWYGPGGERIELSARTLANWVNKTANLLVDELDVGAGSIVEIRMAPHWKSIVIDCATQAAGGTAVWVAPADHAGQADLIVTDRPPGDRGSVPLLVVEPAALARAFTGGPLPADAMDFAAEVTGQNDVFAPCEPTPLPKAEPLPPGERILLRTTEPQVAERLLAALRADGSVVLAIPEIPNSTLSSEGVQPAQT